MTETYGYDKTPTPPRDYDVSKVPESVSRRARWVRTKYTGEQVAEAYAQGLEISGLTAGEAKKIAEDTQYRQDAVETNFAQLESNVSSAVGQLTEDAEVVMTRTDSDGKTFETIYQRFNAEIGKRSEFRPDEVSLVQKMKNEFIDRGINSIWKGTGYDALIQSINDSLILEKDLLVHSGEYKGQDIKIEGTFPSLKTLNFSDAKLVPEKENYNDFFMTVSLQNAVLENLIIDGEGKNTKGILFENCENLTVKKLTVRNLKVPEGLAGATTGVQIDVSTCRNLVVEELLIHDLQANDNNVIGDWNGAVKGLLLLGDGVTDNSRSNIKIKNIIVRKLKSEDADGIHIQNCGLNDIKIENYDIMDCSSRMVKIQGSWGSTFKEGITEESIGVDPPRRSHISDYSGGNNFIGLKNLNCNAVHALEITPTVRDYLRPTVIKDMFSEMKGLDIISGEINSPVLVSKTSSQDILKNYTFENIRGQVKTRGMLIYTHTENLVLSDIGFSGRGDDNSLPVGVILTSDYDSESGQSASHKNLTLDNIFSEGLPVSFGAATTVRFGKAKGLKALNGADPYVVLTSNARNDITLEMRTYRGTGVPTSARGVTYNQGDIIYLARPLPGNLIYGWVCVESGDPGVWKAMYFGEA